MDIDFTALGLVAAVSLGVGVLVVAVFALGVRAWSLRTNDGEDAEPVRPGTMWLATIGAGLCFLACALVVLYGIYLIVPQLSG